MRTATIALNFALLAIFPEGRLPAIIGKTIGQIAVHLKRRNGDGGSFQFEAVAAEGDKTAPPRGGAVIYGGLT